MVRTIRILALTVSAAALAAAAGWFAYRAWQAQPVPATAEPETEAQPIPAEGSLPVRLSPQARSNLGLVSRPLRATEYWRVLELPALVVDRPGVSDRGVVAPVAGTVVAIHAAPGDTVEPDGPLFTLRLVSESLQAAQLELLKASQELEITLRHRERLEGLAESGALARARIIEIDDQIERLRGSLAAHRQDLQARGLPAEAIESVARGEFVSELVVRAPAAGDFREPQVALVSGVEAEAADPPFRFEVQTLAVQLGEHVSAGTLLGYLADHRLLWIEARGFERDMPPVQRAVRNGWGVVLDFDADTPDEWNPLQGERRIEHVSNTIDPQTRTFAFYLSLENQWRTYTFAERERLLWRFRPGSRLRVRVPVEHWDNVFVLPRAAVIRDGPEAYVFRQNGDLFDRRPVHVLHEDRLHAVLANDGSLRPGFFIAQGGAAALQRAMKSQPAGGLPPGFHVHADGSIHAPH